MIHWLVQFATEHPDLARGAPPPGVFSPAELLRLDQFRFEKRRRDWLLGRWTAKQLLCSYLRQRLGLEIPLDQLIVAREAGGAPLAVLAADQARALGWPSGSVDELPLIGAAGQQPAGPAPIVSGVRLPASLSISHSGDAAFCALLPAEEAGPGQRVGADIERIEARSPQFCQAYLAAAEQQWIASAPPEQAETLTTATWSAKEAALKALQLGLTVDTRRVTALCRLDGAEAQWLPVQIEDDGSLTPRPLAGNGVSTDAAYRLSGWWRVVGDYVLTMALLQVAGQGQREPV